MYFPFRLASCLLLCLGAGVPAGVSGQSPDSLREFIAPGSSNDSTSNGAEWVKPGVPIADLPGTGTRTQSRSLRSLPGADRKLASLELTATPLSEALSTLNRELGINAIASQDAGKTLITANLRNVSAAGALQAIVNANGLFYRVDEEGIVRIATAKEYERDLASFRDEETRVFTLLYPNPMAVAQVIQQVFGMRVQMQAADADFMDMMDLFQRFNRFDLVDGRALGLGTFEGGGQAGGGFGGGMGMGGMGMRGMGMRGMGMRGMGMGGMGMGMGGMGMGMGGMGMGGALGGLGMGRGGLTRRSRTQGGIGGLTTPDAQALSDLTAAEIQLLEDQLALVGDLTDEQRADLLQRREATIYVSVIRRNNQVVVRTGDSRTMTQIEQLIARLDVPTPTVLLEVKVMRVELADGLNSAFEYFGGNAEVAGAFSDGSPFSVPPAIPFPGGSSASRTLAQGLGVGGSVPGALTFQVIDENFRFRMQLLESKNRVTSLATPLILTANNEVSRIFVGDTLPFTVGFTPAQIVGGGVGGVAGAVAATPVTELRDVGQSLLITPNINADRTVTLRIVEENSERVLNGASIPVPSADGADLNIVNVDTVRRRTVSGTVVAQDGMAVALGGLIEEQLIDTRDQVPILGDIPGIGFLFRRQVTGRQRSELIVMIRPYVFQTASEGSVSQCVVGNHSLHPIGPDPQGTMNSYLPCEVIRPDPECKERAQCIRLHSIYPAVY